jgi:predicted transcriptional regulator
MAEKPKTEKKAVLVLRDRMGGMSDGLKEYVKGLNKIRRDIIAALKGGPKTVPELARATGLEPKAALWHVMAMRRYGMVVEGERRGDYFEYVLKEGV